MSSLFCFPLTSADVTSPSVVLLIFLSFTEQLTFLNCETANVVLAKSNESSYGSGFGDAGSNQTKFPVRPQINNTGNSTMRSGFYENRKSINFGNINLKSDVAENRNVTDLENPPQGKELENISFRTGLDENRNLTVLTFPPQNNTLGNITMKSGIDENENVTAVTATSQWKKLGNITMRSLPYLWAFKNTTLTNIFDVNKNQTVLKAPPQEKPLGNITPRTVFDKNKNLTVLKTAALSNKTGNITMRSGFNLKNRITILEDFTNEHRDRLSRLYKELESRTSPKDLTLTFMDIAELEDHIKDHHNERDIPRNLRATYEWLEENVQNLKKLAKKKLMGPLGKDIDKMLQNLDKFKAKRMKKEIKKKILVLQETLKEMKHDLQTLNTKQDLELLKRKVDKVLHDIQNLKTSETGGHLEINQFRKDVKWLSSGMSHYIVRYSVWLVPNKEINKFLDKHKT